MRILSIETSCDETSIALLEAGGTVRAPRFEVLENLVASQIAIHAPYGGVVPSLAKREHLRNLPILFERMSRARRGRLGADLIAVTVGPGLEPALWTGIEFAKGVYEKLRTGNKKLGLVGVNHLEGHLYSFLLAKDLKLKIRDLFPAVALIVSGGHTILLRVTSLARWQKLGETRDDAVGEAFDKVARLLGLPYPGGPEIERLARRGSPAAVAFPRPMLHASSPAGEYDFSFSGLKTAVRYYLRNGKRGASGLKQAADVAASFQQAAIDVLVAKAGRAARACGARSLMLSGGVAANRALREALGVESARLRALFLAPPASLNTDNAAVIGAAGYLARLRKKNLPLAARGNLDL